MVVYIASLLYGTRTVVSYGTAVLVLVPVLYCSCTSTGSSSSQQQQQQPAAAAAAALQQHRRSALLDIAGHWTAPRLRLYCFTRYSAK
jgi:hypothetical protein